MSFGMNFTFKMSGLALSTAAKASDKVKGVTGVDCGAKVNSAYTSFKDKASSLSEAVLGRDESLVAFEALITSLRDTA